MKSAIKLCLAIVMLCIATLSHADCSTAGSVTLSIQSISMPARNAPLITPISPWSSTIFTAFSGCTLNQQTNISIIGGASIVGYYTDPTDGVTYPVISRPGISPSGVGFILGVGPDSSHITALSYPVAPVISITPSINSIPAYVKVRLMRYATINTSKVTINTGVWAYLITTYQTTARIQTGTPFFTFPSMIAASCSVNTSNIAVNLPSIIATQLSTVGATAASVPFNISLNCPNPVDVYMTMTDNSNPTQTSTIISAASGSTTQGVGVQIKRNGSALALGPDSSNAGTSNQFQIGSGLSGMVSIPLSANYIRTGTITGGSLQAKATFTMSYQ